jgi:hypothetical protein
MERMWRKKREGREGGGEGGLVVVGEAAGVGGGIKEGESREVGY